MISIVIPTLNAQETLPACLKSLFAGLLDGAIKELIIVDGGSVDFTVDIAKQAGAQVFSAPTGRGAQLKFGGEKAQAQWLLFLHADTVLDDNWHKEVEKFISRYGATKAGIFNFHLDDESIKARMLEKIVWWRCRLFGLPYGDQGLLISKDLYQEIGGFEPLVLMEDVSIIAKIGRKRLHFFKAGATTSAQRYQNQGYLPRMLKNARCLIMWYLGFAPEKILEKYK